VTYDDCVIVNVPEVLGHPLPEPVSVQVPVIEPPVKAVSLVFSVPLTVVLVSVSVFPFAATVIEKVPLT
jgi:hypothetical protein